MSQMKLALTLSAIVAASPALAQSSDRDVMAGAPAAGPDARYCMRVEAPTNTRLERVRCWTREQWADLGVDVDRDWAREGVRIIE